MMCKITTNCLFISYDLSIFVQKIDEAMQKTRKSIEKQLKVLVFIHFSLIYNKNALTL